MLAYSDDDLMMEFILINNDGLPAIVPKKDEPIDANFFVPLVNALVCSYHDWNYVTHIDTERLDQLWNIWHCCQRWKEPTIAKRSLDDIIWIRFAADKKLRVLKNLCHAVNVCWTEIIVSLCQNTP